MKKWISILVVLILVSSLVIGCSSPSEETSGEDSDVIKIGIFEPLTGANAAGGAMEVEGIELANEMFPEVLGKKVVLVTADNKSEKVEAANAVTYLIDKENVNAIIGSWGSSLSMAAGPIAMENQIPIVAPSAKMCIRDRVNSTPAGKSRIQIIRLFKCITFNIVYPHSII